MGRIFANKSLNDGYRYVWDEDTKFIIYQNNKGTIILGTINHGESIKEREIKKLYKLEIQNFGIFYNGSGGYLSYSGNIYIQNFLKLAYFDEVKKVLQELSILNTNIFDYKYALKNKESQFKYRETISLESDDANDYPKYWKLESDNGKKEAIMIENIILKILFWFYDIGRTRIDCNLNIEDYRNWNLFRVIQQSFMENSFQVIEEPNLSISDVYEIAEKENKIYDRIMKYLNDFNKKRVEQKATSDKIEEASKKAILYYSIIGEPYLFKEKLEEARNELKLSRNLEPKNNSIRNE